MHFVSKEGIRRREIILSFSNTFLCNYELNVTYQWWIQGRAQGARAPFSFRPFWGPKVLKKKKWFFETAPPPPPLSQGLDDQALPLSEGLDLPLLIAV